LFWINKQHLFRTAGYEIILPINCYCGTGYTITITPTWSSAIYSEGYAVWIDYNQNGVFTDAGEKFGLTASTINPVSGSLRFPPQQL
jgi:hypothetical protein